MGCASTKVGNSPTVITENIENNNRSSKVQGVHPSHHTTADIDSNGKVLLDQNANSDAAAVPDGVTVKAAVTFEVPLLDIGTNSLIKRHPPKRLQNLEPLGYPVLTAEMLAEKQRVAEEKRAKIMQKKANSGQRASKRRRELEQAVLYSKANQQQQMEEQLHHADTLREARQEDIIERQRIREERAMRVREKAKRLNEDYEIANVEISASFDDDDDAIGNSWLDDEKPVQRDDTSEKIYDGYASPKKAVSRGHAPGPVGSASSTDSYERSFLQESKLGKQTVEQNGHADDFFDA